MEVKLKLQKAGLECSLDIRFTDSSLVLPEEERQKISAIIRQESFEIARKAGKERFCMAIGRRVLELLENKMMTEKQEQTAQVFQFQIKLNEAEFSEETPATPDLDLAALLAQSKILMVEDNPLNIFVGQKFLQKWGIEVAVAENGKIALEMMQQSDFDLVLMDLQMPEMDGYETTESIRRLPEKRKATTPVLAISAALEKHVKDRAMHAGMNDFVLKPFNAEELHEKLTKYLLERRM